MNEQIERFIRAFNEFGERNNWTVISEIDADVDAIDRQQVAHALAAVQPEPGLDALLDSVGASEVNLTKMRDHVGAEIVLRENWRGSPYLYGRGGTYTQAVANAVAAAKKGQSGE